MLSTVSDIAKQAGKILLSHYKKLDQHAIEEKSVNDFVSIADKESEAHIIRELSRHFPSTNVLAEESGYTENTAAQSRWIIDPLDGTRNFIQGIPYFVVSIALEERGELTLGVIYDPVHNDLFAAEKGKGATRNGVRMAVSSRSNFNHAFLATGFPFRRKDFYAEYQAAFAEIFNGVSNIRRCGAAALDMAYVAAGHFDGFWEIGLNAWDIAAGALLIREAGGAVSDFWGSNTFLNYGHIAAGNSVTHQKLTAITSAHFKKEDMIHVE